MTRLDLPDGQWAELDDPQKVPERKRRPYLVAMTAFTASMNTLPRSNGNADPGAFGTEQDNLLNRAMDLLTLCLLKAWSYEPPITEDTLLDLPKDAFDLLRRTCRDLRDQLAYDYSPTPVDDPKVVTGA